MTSNYFRGHPLLFFHQSQFNSNIFLHYIVLPAEESINLSFSSTSPDSTSQSLSQTSWTTSPFTKLMELSRTKQLSLSGATFLSGVSPEESLRICLKREAETIGWRLTWAWPILSSALNRSLSNTSCTEPKMEPGKRRVLYHNYHRNPMWFSQNQVCLCLRYSYSQRGCLRFNLKYQVFLTKLLDSSSNTSPSSSCISPFCPLFSHANF